MSSLIATQVDSGISSPLNISFPDKSRIETLYCVRRVSSQLCGEDEKQISPDVAFIEISVEAAATT